VRLPCGPPDFHAYVEAYLGDRWYIFDPSGTAIPMGFVRLGTGRDAADVAVATIFGGVKSKAPLIRAAAIEDGRARHRAAASLRPCAVDGWRYGDCPGRLRLRAGLAPRHCTLPHRLHGAARLYPASDPAEEPA
jgi:hypothetical protein